MGIERFSEATKGKVILLHQGDPQGALERLNRITGLHFARWPESLAPHSAEPEAQPQAEKKACAVRAGV